MMNGYKAFEGPDDRHSTDGHLTPKSNRRRSRVLLTGAAGFLGSHLADRLLAEGFEVIGVDNFLTGRAENLAHLANQPEFKFIEQDVADPFDVPGELDWILHFASPASPPKYQASPIACLRTNASGTFHLLELARTKRASFFLASTSEVYGDPEVHPQVETYRGSVSVDGPRSMYDEAKRYAEAMTAAYRSSHGLNTRTIRIFNTYGPRMDPEDGRVISNFVCQAIAGNPLTVYGQGQQTRSFQYVDDLISAIMKLMQVDYCGPINLGNPEEHSILSVAKIIQQLIPEHGGLRFHTLPKDDPTQRRPDIALAQRLLDWTPQVSLKEGLRKIIPYFEEAIAPKRAQAKQEEQKVERAPAPAS